MLAQELNPADFAIEKHFSPYRYPLYSLSPESMQSYAYTVHAGDESFTVVFSEDEALLGYLSELCLAAPRSPSLLQRLLQWLRRDGI